MVKFHESRGEVSPRQRDCKRNVHDVDLVGGSARITIVQKMEQRFTGLVAVSSTHAETVLTTSWEGGNYGTGEMWKNKPLFRLALDKAASDEIAAVT